jgi:hypothetical protein
LKRDSDKPYRGKKNPPAKTSKEAVRICHENLGLEPKTILPSASHSVAGTSTRGLIGKLDPPTLTRWILPTVQCVQEKNLEVKAQIPSHRQKASWRTSRVKRKEKKNMGYGG